jgi:Chalcone isomerase-like
MKFAKSLLAALALSSFALSADALEPGKDGFYHTGSAVRTKSIAFVSVKVYAIRHDIKCQVAKSKQAVIEADCDKRFSWKMLRDVDHEKIEKALREAFENNGYTDKAKIDAFVGAFKNELKENNGVSISYNAEKKATTIWVQGGGSATVAGADFMKGVWSIWFGKIDQSSLSDALISNL